MQQLEIIGALKAFPLIPYLIECRRDGRANVPVEIRKQASALFTKTMEELQHLEDEQAADEALRQTLLLAQDFLSAEHFLFVHKVPRYAAYMNMPVLERFLISNTTSSARKSTEGAWKAIGVLLSDWIHTEETALEKHASPDFDRINFVAEKVSRRLEILAKAAAALPTNCNLPQLPDLEDICIDDNECDWHFFANCCGGTFPIAYITALPMSRYHDEYMFLRSANVAECCFWAIVRAIECAAAALERASPVETVQHLNSGAELASFMTRIFVTFDTLSYESFYNGFRPATGNASTIQSKNYQRMDFLDRGFNERKGNALRKHCEVAALAADDCEGPPTLRWLSRVAEQHALGGEITDAIHNLRRHLLMWRAKHLGIARRFLPAGVVGTGDEGFSYLFETFRDP